MSTALDDDYVLEPEEPARRRTASYGIREDILRQLETSMQKEPWGLTADEIYEGRDQEQFGDWSRGHYINRLSQMAGMQRWKVVRIKGRWMVADFIGINHKPGTQRNPIKDDNDLVF